MKFPHLDNVCPARAGMIRQLACEYDRITGLPRTRGDDPVGVLACVPVGGFAPHARG